MSKSNQAKAGEWWQYNGVRVYVVGVTLSGRAVCEYHDRSIAVLTVGEWWIHLSDCDSWGWKPLTDVVMRDDGQPTEPGFYWTLRVGTKHTQHGTPEVIELKRRGDGEMWANGFGDMELSEIGFAWQKVKPFDARYRSGDAKERPPL